MKALTTLGLVLILAASAAAQQPPSPPATTRVLVNEGSVLHGAITGGTVIVKTTFGGEIRIDPRRIQSLVGTTLTLDDGSVVHGAIGAGQVTLASAFGTLSIPADRVTEIQALRVGAAAAPGAQPATPGPTAPAVTARAAPPAPQTAAVAPKPTTASVKFVNDTRRSLNVCVNDETPCLQLGPQATTSRTLPLGPLRLRVESTTTLGFVVLATGSFQRSVQVADAETTVRVTEDDFR